MFFRESLRWDLNPRPAGYKQTFNGNFFKIIQLRIDLGNIWEEK